MFAFWYITRVYMALTICIGPFIILLFLWDATRGFFQRWIGMLIGLTCLSLTSTILLRILLVSMNRTLAVLTYDSGTEFTVAENAFEGVLGVFSLSMIAMFVLPATFSFGAGAAVAATNGIIVSAASRIGGTAVRGSAALGRFLGRHA
jgi:type IV secretion system protein VirB6